MSATSPDPHHAACQVADGAGPGPLSWCVKRTADIAASAILLIAFAPILALVAVIVYAHGHQRVVRRQTRIGYGGRAFRCFSFQPTHHDADRPRRRRSEASNSDNPRVGEILLRSGIENLPQLVNVLMGQMSIVGPRPLSQVDLLDHGRSARWYLSVRPGITGLWQIAPDRRLDPSTRGALDQRYASDWSLANDLLIILKTPAAALTKRGSR